MALMRIKSPEQLRYHPAGEGGKLLGLDRIPEVRTLREKITLLAQPDNVKEWGEQLSQKWMTDAPEVAGTLYVDGHVRVYNGSQTKLPRRYVARQRLCLRGMTDYWVNDELGRPFFVLSSPFNSGMLSMLKSEIIPRLLDEVPNQPTEDELKTNRHLHRFTLVFDREGYSPAFFAEMWRLRIACQTYHKFPKENWPTSEFKTMTVRMPGGQNVEMKLAERGVFLGKKIWLREIRKLGETGHQTSVISTDYSSDASQIAAHMFTRWCQENFFRYMIEHYHLDRLIDYDMVTPDETIDVVNPIYRKLESAIKSVAAKKYRKQAEFGALSLQNSSKTMGVNEIERYEIKKGTILDEIKQMEDELEDLKQQRKENKKHIAFSELPEEDKFLKLAPTKKQFMETIRMIAYRAETALVLCHKRNDGKDIAILPVKPDL